jgi:biotin synthase-like enzyme
MSGARVWLSADREWMGDGPQALAFSAGADLVFCGDRALMTDNA